MHKPDFSKQKNSCKSKIFFLTNLIAWFFFRFLLTLGKWNRESRVEGIPKHKIIFFKWPYLPNIYVCLVLAMYKTLCNYSFSTMSSCLNSTSYISGSSSSHWHKRILYLYLSDWVSFYCRHMYMYIYILHLSYSNWGI